MELVLLAVVAAALLVVITLINRTTSGLDRKHFQQRWQKIEKIMQTPDVGLQLAVIDADKLLDQALKQTRTPGETMGERLRSARGRIKNYQAVWDAHKLRNRLVHEDVKLKKSQARTAVGAFKSALKQLGAL